MAEEWSPPESWLVVMECDGTALHCMPSDEGQVDAKATDYRHSGRDCMLHLTMAEGSDYALPASRVAGWYVNTPEFRRRNAIREHARREEDKAMRAAIGLPWEEDV